MVGVDQLQVDHSPPNSVNVITHLYLMILDVPLRWSDVRNLMPFGSIGTWLAGCQGDRLVLPQ